jgi:hypothetical protein
MRWVLMALLVAGCARKTPEQKLAGEAGTAASWVATFQFASEAWLANRVPGAFLRDTIQSGEKNLQKSEQSVEESEANERMRATVRDSLKTARVASAELKAALERGDRAGVARARMRFAAAYSTLHEVEETNR